MKYKLPKSGRLHDNSQFQTVYRTGRSVANRMAVLHLVPNEQAISRIGFAAGKRLGNAVVRNRVKRLLREAYRLQQFRVKPGFDMVLVGRQALIEADLQKTVNAFLDLCLRAKILNK
ncbi:ribonuclease P protein component [Azotosporobacter soli]|uniref:ribonuclease P protein component n=1 Tax=Azotosporobacter soli TaxID=3055040 RepID=UPI0031FED1E7